MTQVKILLAWIAQDEGYQLHRRRKLHVRRRHQRQEVTGLVVNRRANLSRKTRRWLRAVEHRAGCDWRNRPHPEAGQSWQPTQKPTLTEAQLAGWRGLVSLIARHRR